MSKRHKRRERLKSALIVALILSAVFMVMQMRPFSSSGSFPGLLRDILSPGSAAPDSEQGGKISLASGANAPFCISVMSETGRWAALNDDKAVTAAFHLIGSVLGEALGSAENAQSASESEWRAALAAESVYFDYFGSVPAGVLAGWLGTVFPPDLPAVTLRRVLLTVGDGGAELWFRDEADGAYYRCATGVKRSAFEALLAASKPNGAAFAFELGEGFSGLDPYTVLPGETPSPEAVRVSNPLEKEPALDRLFQALGFSRQSSFQYSEAGGNVYVESAGTLRISADGNVLFRASSGTGQTAAGGALTEAGAVAFARYLAKESAVLPGEGEQDIYLASVTREGEVLSAVFNYSVGGIPVHLEGGKNALSITFHGGGVTRVEMNVRAFYRTGDAVLLLPEPLAAAAAAVNGPGRELRLWYVPNPAAVFDPVWRAE